MKKILYVITKSNWGGAQRYVYDLATHLPRDEYDVGVTLGGTGEQRAEAGLLEQKLKENPPAGGIRTVFVNSFMRDISFFQEGRVYKELKKNFKEEKPDVVHLNSSKAGGLGALAARRAGIKKIVFTSHGLAYDEDRNIVARGFIWLATWFTFLLCHEVIVISKDNAKRASKLPFCAKKITLVHNGIGPVQFVEKDAARATLSNKMAPLPQSTLWVGTIAELTWNKGLHYLVRAAGELKRKGVDFALCIVGEGGERIFLETMITDEGLQDRVYLVGFVENAAQYLKAFDVFALTSVKEGLPYVLMEAGLAGNATVATNVGGVSDIVGDKVSGLLFKTKNHNDLADKLEMLIKDASLRERYGSALRAYVEQEFSLITMVEKTKKIYIS